MRRHPTRKSAERNTPCPPMCRASSASPSAPGSSATGWATPISGWPRPCPSRRGPIAAAPVHQHRRLARPPQCPGRLARPLCRSRL